MCFNLPISYSEKRWRLESSLKGINSPLSMYCLMELVHASKEDCYDCHDDIQEKLYNDLHADLSCLICHGPGLEHVNNPEAGNILKTSSREFCGRCHQLNAARSTDVIWQVDITTHYTEKENCIDCHNPHEVWEGVE